jgi:hypothetical protein
LRSYGQQQEKRAVARALRRQSCGSSRISRNQKQGPERESHARAAWPHR